MNGWEAYLDLSSYQALFEKVERAYAEAEVYPPRKELFSAFALTPPSAVRVVILGQDPYHEPGQAHGLAFSVREGVKLPPSLVNIYKEREADVGVPLSQNGDLTSWAKQGVLLLNSVLTVEKGKANSHKDFGWQAFTDDVVAAIAKLPQPVAFVLWGAQAQKKAAVASASVYPRLVLQSPHPSPLSSYRGFFGSKPFSQINAFLQAHEEDTIQW
ncbi:MAG: uracil-DNA glycosylase [Oscillospiraceae bacterium]|nr:uracil-DNA glycosylase [Oscillospiraceae bacterium]